MALSRFMPYGAPDLLADQDERMAKATMSAMALLALLFAGVGIIVSHLPRTVTIPPIDHVHSFDPPPLIPNYQPPVAPAAPHVTPSSPHALPVPVPEAPPSVPVTPTMQGSGQVAPDAHSGGGGGEVAPDPGGGEAPPAPGQFVYVDEFPELIHSASVVYPDIAREAGVEGRVVVLMLVGKDGRVLDARVDPKHSVPMLDAAALDAARSSVFKPALTNGHPVMVWVSRPYDFRLH